MIVYFASRKMKILGHATTNLPSGFVVMGDKKVEDVDTGIATFECTIGFNDSNRKQLETMMEAGNYVLRSNGKENEFYTIIESEINTKEQSIWVYCEDAGLDLINEIAEPFAATGSFTAEYYINKWIADSGFEIGINEIPETSTRKLSWDGEATVTERLASIATQFGGYDISYSFEIKGMEITKKFVNIYEKRGKDIGEALRLNRDIDRIVIKKSVAELATALKVTGGTPEDSETPVTLKGFTYDDGDFYVDTNGILKCRSAAEKWSRYVWNNEPNRIVNGEGHIVKLYSYDTLSQSTLCQHAITELKSICDTAINYEVDIAKLPANIKIGDRVNIVDEKGELFLSSRILVLETSETGKSQKATLGEFLIKDSGIATEVKEMASQFATVVKTANSAASKANLAQTAADDARKVATNFIEFDENSGLIIGNMQAVELGKNVLIDSDSIQFRQSSDVLADFTASKIELGKNSRTSTIDLCNGLAQMRNEADDTSAHSRLAIDADHSISLNAGGAITANANSTAANGTQMSAGLSIKAYMPWQNVISNAQVSLGASQTTAAGESGSASVSFAGNGEIMFDAYKNGKRAQMYFYPANEEVYVSGTFTADHIVPSHTLTLYPDSTNDNIALEVEGFAKFNYSIIDGLEVKGGLAVSEGETTLTALSVTGTTTLSERLYLANAKGIWAKNAAGTGNLSVIGATAENHILINGEGRNNYSNTYLDGNAVYIRTNEGIHTSGKLMLGSKAVIGNNISYAAMHTDGITEMSLALLGASNNSLYGYGSYTNYIGAAYYDGNTVYMRSNNGISLTGTSFKYNNTDVSLDGHKHRELYYTDGIGGVTWITNGGAYYLRLADNTNTYYLGSTNYRWDTIYAKNALNTSSDMRLKKDFSTDYEKYIAMLDLIEPTTFVRTNTTDGKRHTGYLAQKVLKAMHDAGLTEADFAGFDKQMQADGTAYTYGLAYEEFIPILHAKIKQLEQRIEQLEGAK